MQRELENPGGRRHHERLQQVARDQQQQLRITRVIYVVYTRGFASLLVDFIHRAAAHLTQACYLPYSDMGVVVLLLQQQPFLLLLLLSSTRRD